MRREYKMKSGMGQWRYFWSYAEAEKSAYNTSRQYPGGVEFTIYKLYAGHRWVALTTITSKEKP